MKLSTALGISMAAHAVLAAAIVGIIKWNPGPKVVAQLDLSSVELSFADTDTVEAPALPIPEVAPVAPEPPPPEVPPPEQEMTTLPDQPPDFDAIRLPEPTEEPPPMDIPPKVPEAEPQTETAPEPVAQAPVPEPPAPRQARVDAPPQPKRTIRPDYPKGSRQRGEEGDVTLLIEVGRDGLVKSAEVVGSCGFKELEEAAVKAVRKARFNPARKGSDSVASTVQLTISFHLK